MKVDAENRMFWNAIRLRFGKHKSYELSNLRKCGQQTKRQWVSSVNERSLRLIDEHDAHLLDVHWEQVPVGLPKLLAQREAFRSGNLSHRVENCLLLQNTAISYRSLIQSPIIRIFDWLRDRTCLRLFNKFSLLQLTEWKWYMVENSIVWLNIFEVKTGTFMTLWIWFILLNTSRWNFNISEKLFLIVDSSERSLFIRRMMLLTSSMNVMTYQFVDMKKNCNITYTFELKMSPSDSMVFTKITDGSVFWKFGMLQESIAVRSVLFTCYLSDRLTKKRHRDRSKSPSSAGRAINRKSVQT